MTSRGVYILILLAAIGLGAVYVWPTRYRMLDTPVETERTGIEMRVDRITGRVDQRHADGPWTEYIPPPPEYDVKFDSDAGQALRRTQQAADEIKKMNEAAKKAMEH